MRRTPRCRACQDPTCPGCAPTEGPMSHGWKERNALRLAELDLSEARRALAAAHERVDAAGRRLFLARAAVAASDAQRPASK